MQNRQLAVLHRMPDQQLRIFIPVSARDRMPVGEKFVDGPDLAVDQVKEGVDPVDGQHCPEPKQVQRMPLPDMIAFMQEDLPAACAVDIDLRIPEKMVEKRKGGTRLAGHEEIEPAQAF